jgi:hypothetical protein
MTGGGGDDDDDHKDDEDDMMVLLVVVSLSRHLFSYFFVIGFPFVLFYTNVRFSCIYAD